ncbi:MAG: hypothetical protein Q9169_002270 [Polycauliona sp. 2 TL-2023]
MGHVQELTTQASIHRNAGFAKSSTSLNEEAVPNLSPEAESPTALPRMHPQLSSLGQRIADEMEQKASEAQADQGAGYDSDSSDDEDHVFPLAPSFTKRVLPVKPPMATIIEESQSFTFKERLTFSVTIRSNSVHTHTNLESSRVSEAFEHAELETKIAKIDHCLKAIDMVQPCYRERLWKIREEFDDIQRHRDQSDTPQSLGTLRLDLEVQVACQAQANVQRFTHLLLHTDVGEVTKVRLRRYLTHAETWTNPRLDENITLVLNHLKTEAASMERELSDVGPETAAANAAAKEAILRRDVDELQLYLQDMLFLRYDPNQYSSRLNVKNLRPLGQYVWWKSTRDTDTAGSLAKKLGLHPIELESVLGQRLDSLLQHSPMDPGYIQARLCDLVDTWRWVSGHNVLAHLGQWTTLAGQFCDDRAQLDLIFPGKVEYINRENGIHRSNTKARLLFGMIELHCYYFDRLKSADNFKLSALAKSIEKSLSKEQQRKVRERKEQQVQRPISGGNTSPSPTDEDRLSLGRRVLAQLKKCVKT